MSRKTVSFDINPLFSGPTLDARTRSGSPFRLIPIADIDVDPDQPRRTFNSESIAELAASISEYGILSPILVRPNGAGTFKLVAGERRLRACKLLGLESVPAVIDSESGRDGDILAKQLVENLQREDLGTMERALAIGQLRDQFSLSVRDIASRLGISKSAVQRSLDVLSYPDDLQAALIAGAPETKVAVLSRVHDREQRKALLAQLDDLSRAQLEALIAEGTIEVSHRGTDGGIKAGSKAVEPKDQDIVQQIRQAMGLKVHLLRSTKRPERGKLVLEFYNEDDLGEILSRLTSSYRESN